MSAVHRAEALRHMESIEFLRRANQLDSALLDDVSEAQAGKEMVIGNWQMAIFLKITNHQSPITISCLYLTLKEQLFRHMLLFHVG